MRFCNKQTHPWRFFHSLTTIFIDEETIWFKNETYIFVMIRAIFFGSNDLVSGSVVTVQEKKYTMNWLPVHSKKLRSLLLLLTKTFNLVHLEPLVKHKQEIGAQTTAKWGYEIDISKLSVSRKCEVAPSRFFMYLASIKRPFLFSDVFNQSYTNAVSLILTQGIKSSKPALNNWAPEL